MTPLLELDGVHFAYGAAATPRAHPFALEDLSFRVGAGEILGVLGPNSAGKTTLVRLLTKVVEPARGEIRIEGVPLARLTRAELARRVAVVPQDLPHALPFTVEQLVLMGRYPHAPRRYFETAEDRALGRDAMAMTGVLDLASAPLRDLAGGERQRVLLARALAQGPRLLVLDEPTAHLDLRHQVECAGLLRRLNREPGMTIVLVSHDLNLAAELCDRLLLLAEGRLARLGAPAEVLEASLLTAVYGCPITIGRSASGRPLVQVAWAAPGAGQGEGAPWASPGRG